MLDKSGMQKLSNFDGSRDCFACGPENEHGLQMDFYTDGERVHCWLTVDRQHCGRRKLLHGGIVSTILDEAMSWSAHNLLQKLILTKSIQVEFHCPTYVEEPLHVVGRIAAINSEREAVMEAVLKNGAGEKCATGRGIFATMTPKIARRMKVIDEAVIQAFEKHFNL